MSGVFFILCLSLNLIFLVALSFFKYKKGLTSSVQTKGPPRIDPVEQESIIAEMKDGLLVLDRDNCVLRMNREAERLLGIYEADVIGKPLSKAINKQSLIDALLLEVSSDEPLEIELSETSKKSWVQVSKSQLGDSGSIVVLTDISRLKSLEKIRQDFVANVSHELRTPVTSIMGFVETLREGALENQEEARRFLGIIERQSQRLISIIEDLLMLAKLEGSEGASLLDLEAAAVRPQLIKALSYSEHQAAAKDISIKAECQENISYSADWSLLEQAIVNLVDNALKYSDEKSKIFLSAKILDGHLHISVQDEGPGIPEKNLPRLFERFYRVDKARSRSMGGTGLGLAIVKHVANIHGGTVKVESSQEGSQFTIILPANPPLSKRGR